MNSRFADLRAEADEALGKVWFIQNIEEIELTDITLSLRLHNGQKPPQILHKNQLPA